MPVLKSTGIFLITNDLARVYCNFYHILYTLSIMVVRMRHTRAHTANRRSHHALEGVRLSTCKDCGASHVRHQACANCGKYRGRAVMDVHAAVAKKAQRSKAKAHAHSEEPKK